MTQASTEAFLAIQPHLRRSQTLAFDAVRDAGQRGATISEVERATRRDLHQRMSELRAMGWLVDSGDRRDGQTVYHCGTGVPAALRRRGGPAKAIGEVVNSRMEADGGIYAEIRFYDQAVAAAVMRQGFRVTVQVIRE